MLSLPINLFDCLFAAALAVGFATGRKHGISTELPRVLKWLALVAFCAALYQPLGYLIAAAGFFDPLSAYLLAYLSTALGVLLLFTRIQRRLTPKLTGTDRFGRGEYYLGMGSGLVRYTCMLLVLLALLNARQFSPADLKRMEQFQEQAYGSKVFPTLYNLQVAVFERSLTGSLIRNYLGFLLIEPTPAVSSYNTRRPSRETERVVVASSVSPEMAASH